MECFSGFEFVPQHGENCCSRQLSRQISDNRMTRGVVNVFEQELDKSKALKFVLLMGIVSLFADMTHEGARSITGPFLSSLGASAANVGIIAGLGEFVGYGVRLFSGKLSDKTGQYWLITIWGYIINLVAVPLLALADNWMAAAVLMVLERMGRAIRNPARDVMLSNVAKHIGRGWAFGMHEALDQVGAMTGPLLVAGIMYLRGDYRLSFAWLAFPMLLCLLTLAYARLTYPKPYVVLEQRDESSQKLSAKFWLYLAATSLVAVGYTDFPLVAYHFGVTSSVPAVGIPIFYSVSMGVAALSALIFGRYFDRNGLSVLAFATVLSAFFAPCVFGVNIYLAFAGMIFWGIGMGAHESIMRAAIAEMVPMDRRGFAYGLFNSIYGFAWFLGSAGMGYLYDLSVGMLIVFSVAVQLVSVPLFIIVGKMR